MKKIKISIIGGSGFIGQVLCDKLSKLEIDFEILDIVKPVKYLDRYKYCDIRRKDSLIINISGNCIVNLAATHSDNAASEDYKETNVIGAKNVTSAAIDLAITHIIFTSSVAVYSLSNDPIDEDCKKEPFTEYGTSKLAAERIFLEWLKEADGHLSIIRPTAIFGEGNRGNIHKLFLQIYRKRYLNIDGGRCVKSIAYVQNVAAYIVQHIIESPKCSISNYSDGPDMCLRNLTNLVSQELHKKPIPAFFIPKFLLYSVAILLDFISSITQKNFGISRIRVKKLTSNSIYKSNTKIRQKFEPPYTFKQAIVKTLTYEFKKVHR